MMNENDFYFLDPSMTKNGVDKENDSDTYMSTAIFLILKKLFIALVMILLISIIASLTSCSTTKHITDVTSDSVKIETNHHSDVKDSAAISSFRKDSTVQQTNHISTDSTSHRIQDSITTMLIVDQNGKVIGKEVSRSHYDSRDHFKNTMSDNVQNKTSDNQSTEVTVHQSNTKDSSDSSAVHRQKHEQTATAPKLSFFQNLKSKLRMISIISIIAFIIGIIVAVKYRTFISGIFKTVILFIRKIIN